MELYIFGIIFIIVTIGFFVLRNFIDSSSSNLLTYLYFFLLVVLQYFLNIKIGNMVCGFNDYTHSLLYTFLPWLLIFGSTYAFLWFFPNWLNPFSNTFGILFTTFPINMYSLFSNVAFNNKKEKILDFLNKNDISSIRDFITKENIAETIQIGDQTINTAFTLENIIKTKNSVSTMVFYGLTMLIVFFVSLSYMFTSGCKMSVAEMQKRNKEFFIESNKKK